MTNEHEQEHANDLAVDHDHEHDNTTTTTDTSNTTIGQTTSINTTSTDDGCVVFLHSHVTGERVDSSYEPISSCSSVSSSPTNACNFSFHCLSFNVSDHQTKNKFKKSFQLTIKNVYSYKCSYD